MGPGQNFLTPGWINFLWLRLGRVSHLWFGFELGKFPLKMSNFSIFFPSGLKKLLRVGSEGTQVKAGSASYLLRAKSRLGSGQGPSLVKTPGLTWKKPRPAFTTNCIFLLCTLFLLFDIENLKLLVFVFGSKRPKFLQ